MEIVDVVEVEIYEMPLAQRDTCLIHIEKQIHAKEKMLMDKKREIKEALKQNYFLEQVNRDYQTYYNYIVKKKKEELEAMITLQQYTEELMMNAQITEEETKKIKREQQHIIREMNIIKKALNNNMEN